MAPRLTKPQAAPARFVLPTSRPLPLFAYLVRLGVFVALTLSTAAVAAFLGIYLHFAPTVLQFASIDDFQPKLGSRIYSADNQLIGEFAIERRVLVPPQSIPPLLARAFMAAEDKRFYEHGGLDYIGIVQAVVDKVIHPKEKLRGASTITQQVGKSLLATHETYESATERSLNRKVREAILARHLEATLSKDQILYMYLTQTFLGHKAYGVGAAAEHYFRKNVWELTLAEMATLAGLPQRPSDYSPVTRPQAALGRRGYVLRRMLQDGFIDQAQYAEAQQEKLVVYPREESYLQVAPWYTEQVRRELIDRYGERALLEEGLEVYTAINLEHQALAQAALDRGMRDLDKRQGYRGPLAHLTPKQRTAFASKYREVLKWRSAVDGAFEPGNTYLAVVTAFEADGTVALLDVAGKLGLLPLAGMRWARKPNSLERVDAHYLTDVRQALHTGDVVQVLPTTAARLARDVHGSRGTEVLPKEGTLFALDQEPITESSMMAVDPRSGYIRVQIGGYDFDESSYNRAVQACREPGSVFKPVVYSAAIDKYDYTASTLIDDKPIVYDDFDNATRWKPNNAGEEFRGRLPMRTCLKDSINTPAIRIAEAVGIDDVIKNAKRLGITTPMKRELGTALGSSCTTLLDLMNLYTTLNQYGTRRELHFIRRVVDRFGNVIEDAAAPHDPTLDFGSQVDRAYRNVAAPGRQVLDAPTAFLMTSLLKNVVDSGTGMAASHIGQIIAGKTGTTNDSYDAWFMGFTRNLLTGVWVGHDKKERPLGINEQGGRTALPIWVDYMQNALLDRTVTPARRVVHGDFIPPPGVVQVLIDPDTGLLARRNGGRTVLEWYRAGSEPTDYTPDRAQINPTETDFYKADQPY
jgi:penicillin-binding protein 1A